MDTCAVHSSGVDHDLKILVTRRRYDGFLVEMSQDVHPRYFLPAVLSRRRLFTVWRRQHEVVGEDVVLKLVALISSKFLLQQGQQL